LLSEVAWDWLRPVRRVLLALVPLTIAVCWLSEPLTEWIRVLLRGVLLGGLGICVLLRYGLPIELKREFMQRMPNSFGRRMRPVIGDLR
jgi:hypothetical protein